VAACGELPGRLTFVAFCSGRTDLRRPDEVGGAFDAADVRLMREERRPREFSDERLAEKAQRLPLVAVGGARATVARRRARVGAAERQAAEREVDAVKAERVAVAEREREAREVMRQSVLPEAAAAAAEAALALLTAGMSRRRRVCASGLRRRTRRWSRRRAGWP